ncbi:hypothetical protein AMATHDRAFT_58838 [Amanita thiersii Skay4041]|uniref:NUZM, NADH-ubiquinone oxidoreductase 21.3 kDa subunit n=1 Tax=Amanita thiersii Skay4041 TaxID=703135 RepID=A0A2A9NQ80_9AGAR|nr:hypothetical protein AMATHDRAFT_58838 [Amanita thiersii Skay4041]
MAIKKAADSTLYHLSPKGFWKKFREAVSANPEVSSGLPVAGINRYPPPASRPERYSTPATKASDPAQNPYWKRDVRRVYPQLSVVAQSDLSTLLIQHSKSQMISATGNKEISVEQVSDQSLDLTRAISNLSEGARFYTESKLPPMLPIAYRRWMPQLSPPAPHDHFSYFPMLLYR